MFFNSSNVSVLFHSDPGGFWSQNQELVLLYGAWSIRNPFLDKLPWMRKPSENLRYVLWNASETCIDLRALFARQLYNLAVSLGRGPFFGRAFKRSLGVYSAPDFWKLPHGALYFVMQID